jgi:hypothetical protein
MTFNAAGRHDDALRAAELGLSTIAENGEEKVDEAFLSLQVAAAHKGLGQAAECGAALEKAENLASGFETDGLKSWFRSEAEKI